MVRRNVSLFLLLVLASGFTALSQSHSLREEQDFAFALGLLKDGNASLAAEQFRSFAEQYPTSPQLADAWYYRGEALFAEGRLTDAGIVYRDFQRRWPQSHFADEAGFRQGEIFFRQEQFPQAFDTFSSVLREYPSSSMASEAAYWAGESALRSQETQLAMRYYTIAYENYPDGRVRDFALYSIGYVLEVQQSYEEAIATYTSLLKHFSSSSLTPFARTRIGSCLLQLGQADSAIVWLDGLSDGPDQDNAAERLYLKSEARYRTKRFQEAESGFKSFLAAYPLHPRSRQVQYSLGWSLVEQQKYSESLVVFDTLAHGTDELAQAARYRTGMVQRITRRYDAAQRTFLALIADFPSGPYSDNAQFELGMTAVLETDYAVAEKRFEEVIARYPESDILPDAWLMLAESRLAAGKSAESVPAFESVMSMRGASQEMKTRARLMRANALLRSGKYAEVVKAVDEFLPLQSSAEQAINARLWRAEARFGLRDFESALKEYRWILESDASADHKEDALYGLGWTELRLERHEAAEKTFRRLLSDFPQGRRTVEARVRIADAQYATRRFVEAAQNYRAVAKQHPSDSLAPYARLQQGMSEHRAGDSPAGLATLRGFLSTAPRSTIAGEARYGLGWILFQNKDYSAAMEEFRTLLSEYPNHGLAPRAQYTIADGWYNLGQFEEAEAAYRVILSRYPTSPLVADALDGIAECLRMRNKHEEADRVRQDWLRANAASTVADEVAYTQALSLLRNGERDKAIAILQEFATTWPNSEKAPDALLLLGRGLAESRDNSGAKRAFAEVVRRAPSTRVAFDAEHALGILYLDEQEADSAFQVFDTMAQLPAYSIWSQEALLGRARARIAQKDPIAGRADLNMVIDQEPGTTTAASAVIERARLDARENHPTEAITALDSLAGVRKDALGAQALFLAGQILYMEDKFEDAEKSLLRIGYVYPDEGDWVAQSWLLLGRLYESRHQLDKAKLYFRKTTEQFSGSDSAEEARRRLEKLP